MPSVTAPALELSSARPSATAGVADAWKTLAPQAALRGEFVRALDLYRRLAAVESLVPLHRIRAGDCLVKMGRKREALAEYRVAADAYLALGMQVHARSAWRLVLGIVPGDADATARLQALDARVLAAKPGTPPPAIAPAPRRAHPANTPTAPEAEVRAEKAAARELLALEFADLDDDEDRIWIDLEGIVEPPKRAGRGSAGIDRRRRHEARSSARASKSLTGSRW